MWAIRIALLVGSTLAALLVLEALLRQVTPSQESGDFLVEPPRGWAVPWVLEPGADMLFDGHAEHRIPATTIRISSQGLRASREYAVPPPPDVIRILVLGDSFVFGTGVEVDETLVAGWERALGPGFEVVNMGVPGYATVHAAELLARRGVDLRPHGVVVLLSDNDLYLDGSRRTQEGREELAIQRFAEARLKARQRHESGWHAEPEALTARLDGAVGRLQEICAANGIELQVVPLMPTPLTDVLSAHGLSADPLMDAEYGAQRERFEIPGDRHPNAAGHRALSARLHARLGPWARGL